jgi:polyisoprenoid-binding protein YceI
MKRVLLLSFLLTYLFGQTIDADRSYVKFKVRNMGIRDVSGTITGMQGTVKFDTAQPDSAQFDVTVDLKTINTKNTKRDKHLNTEDFFETNKWPTIRFKSKRIAKQGEVFGVFGSLIIKDVTKEIFVPFKIEETNKTIKFTGGNIVNRLDYNVGVDYNNFKIGFEINVQVVCTINK